MTESDYLATPAQAGKPFTFTRIRGNVETEFLPGEGTRLRFANRAADTLEVVGVPAGFLLAGDTVTVDYLGTLVFRGDVEQRVEDLSRGDDATQQVTVRGPWAKMARLVFRQHWRTGNGLKLSSRLILNQAEDGTNQELNVALSEIAYGPNNATPAACGYQVGTIDVSMQKLPFDETRDITVADAIVRELKFFPAACTRFDYSTTPPTLNISMPDRSGEDAVYVAAVPKTVRQYIYNAHPITGVDLEIETTGEVDGVEYRDITHQTAGDTLAGNPDCLYATLLLAGFSSSAVKQSFTAVVEDPYASYWQGILDPEFWKDKHPRLKNVPLNAIQIVTATRSGAADQADYPNICANTVGEIEEAGLRARVETFSATVKLTTEDDVEEELYLQMQFVTTNAQNRTYTWTASSSATGGETVPTGLAQALLDARSPALREESFTMRLGPVAQWPKLGDLCDGLVLQEFAVDCGALTAELHFGTPDYLSPDDMAALMSGFRNKRRATFSTSRVTGKVSDDAEATVDMGGVMPLSSTEFDPGTKAKTTIKSVASGATTGSISLDSSTLTAQEVITTKTLTIRKPISVTAGGSTIPVQSERKYLATADIDIIIPALLMDSSGAWYICDGTNSIKINGGGGGGSGGGGEGGDVDVGVERLNSLRGSVVLLGGAGIEIETDSRSNTIRISYNEDAAGEDRGDDCNDWTDKGPGDPPEEDNGWSVEEYDPDSDDDGGVGGASGGGDAANRYSYDSCRTLNGWSAEK